MQQFKFCFKDIVNCGVNRGDLDHVQAEAHRAYLGLAHQDKEKAEEADADDDENEKEDKDRSK